jgi:hypothetical protein
MQWEQLAPLIKREFHEYSQYMHNVCRRTRERTVRLIAAPYRLFQTTPRTALPRTAICWKLSTSVWSRLRRPTSTAISLARIRAF